MNSFLIRFDCDLHQDINLPLFKSPYIQQGRFGEETYFSPPNQLLNKDKKALHIPH